MAPPFLILALDEGEWSASYDGCFTLGEKPPGAHWIGGCMDHILWRREMSFLGP
jgi:hypothetical protein